MFTHDTLIFLPRVSTRLASRTEPRHLHKRLPRRGILSAFAAALARPVHISQELGDAPGQIGGAIQWPNQCHQHLGAVVDSIRTRWRIEHLEVIFAIFAERGANAVDDVRIPRPSFAPVALHPCAKGAHGTCEREGFGVHCRSVGAAISFRPGWKHKNQHSNNPPWAACSEAPAA